MVFHTELTSVVKVRKPRERHMLRRVNGCWLLDLRDHASQKRLRALCEQTGYRPGTLIRDAILSTLGLKNTRHKYRSRTNQRFNCQRIPLFLSEAEWSQVRAMVSPRDYHSWVADVAKVVCGQRHLRWSTCAENVVRMKFGRADRDELRRLLPGHSPGGIVACARRLDLDTSRKGWSDHVPLSVAARRIGVAPSTLAKELARQEVPLVRRVTPSPDATPTSQRIVHLPRACTAAKVFLESETINGLARRLDVPRSRLLRCLDQLGHAKPLDCRYWRLSPQQVAQVEDALQAVETIPEACARLHVEPGTLWHWLREDGRLDTRRGGVHRLPKAVIDEVVQQRRSVGRRCSACGERGHRRTTCSRQRATA